MNTKLQFPVFAFQKNDNMIYTFFKERELKSTSTIILKTFDYKNVTLIDSNGNIYKIKQAYKLKYLGLFGFSLIKKGRQILVDYEFDSDIKTTTLSEFKDEIITRIEKKKSFWQSAWDIDELKLKILHCNSFEEIANLIK
jgi:hypothetical protein